MTIKNITISTILFFIFACGGDDITPPPQSPETELSIHDFIFIYEIENILGSSINLNSISENTIETIEGIDYYRIQSLDLSGLSLSHIPQSIGNLDSLNVLDLDNNLLESLPDTLCSCPLEELTMVNNNICLTSSVPECLQDFYNVMNQNCIAYPDENDQEFLDELLSMNSVNDSVADIIKNDRVTWEIKLDGDGLVQRIVKLDFENLGLDTIPFSIGGLEYLEWIELENNSLTSIPESFGSLNELWYLDLYNNQIIDLPTSLQFLTKLQELYIYSNQITELDFSFSNLTSLEKLWINDNQIESIDSSICEILVNLEFYYNNNKLCEILPTCLMNIDLDDQNCNE